MVRIFIDAGHGGSDPGAQANGIKEKDITLKIAKKVQQYLGEYKGVSVKMSRTGDSYPTLTQRTNEANAWGADLFLSIHINAGGGTGYEDYIYTTVSSSSKTGRIQSDIHNEVMKKINMSDRGKKKANLHVLRESAMPAVLTENGFIDHSSDADLFLSIHINAGGGTGYEDYIYTTVSSSSKTGRIQSDIHNEVMKKINMSDRGKKKANLHVLRESAMPAVLTENGFIDHSSD